MKKTVAFLMCLSAAGLLAGCGAKTEATTAAADTTGAASTETKAEAKGDPVVINYYDWDIPDQKFIDDFNAANPDIQVVAHSIPANGERLTKLDILAMSGGDMDVMPISDGDQFTRFESGMLAPLDDFIAKDGVDMDKSFGKYAIWGQYDGKYYGIPFRATQSVVYYNKDMFDKYGIEIPKTFDDLEAAMQKFVDNGVTPLSEGVAEYPLQHLWWQLVLSKANDKFIKNYEMYDGDVDWQGEATTYATKTIKDWVSKGYISKDCTGTKAEDAGQGFMNGTYPMFFSGTWWFGRFQSDMKNANWTFSTFPDTDKLVGFRQHLGHSRELQEEGPCRAIHRHHFER